MNVFASIINSILFAYGIAYGAVAVLVAFCWVMAPLARRIRQRHADREWATRVAATSREDDFTAYADEVITQIFHRVLDESVYDQEAEQ